MSTLPTGQIVEARACGISSRAVHRIDRLACSMDDGATCLDIMVYVILRRDTNGPDTTTTATYFLSNKRDRKSLTLGLELGLAFAKRASYHKVLRRLNPRTRLGRLRNSSGGRPFNLGRHNPVQSGGNCFLLGKS